MWHGHLGQDPYHGRDARNTSAAVDAYDTGPGDAYIHGDVRSASRKRGDRLFQRTVRSALTVCLTLAARGGNGSFRGGEQSVVGKLRERAGRWERFEGVDILFPSQG